MAAGIALDLEGKYEQARQHLTKAIDEAPPASKVQALRTMAVSYAFERNSDEARKYEQQAFDLQFSAKQFADAAGTADELARIYLESGDPDNAFQWYQSGHLTAQRQPDLKPAEKDLWEFRWESALARCVSGREEATKPSNIWRRQERSWTKVRIRTRRVSIPTLAVMSRSTLATTKPHCRIAEGRSERSVRPQLAGAGLREVRRQDASAGLLPQGPDHQHAQSNERVCPASGKRKGRSAVEINAG